MKEGKAGLAVVVALIGVVAPWVQSAHAAPLKAPRTYILSGTRTCVQTPVGGISAAPDLVLSTTATTRSVHLTGTLNLERDGTGSLEQRNLQIFHQRTSAGQVPVSASSATCDVQYGRDPDGSYWIDFIDCEGPVDAGAGVGTIGGTSGATRLSATFSADGSVLMLSNIAPDIESVYTIDASGAEFHSDRVCGRNYVGIRVGVETKER